MHIVRDGSLFADTNLPWKFTENKISAGIARLEMLVDFAKVVGRGSLAHRKHFADADVVPMAVVFTEVANAFVRIEENVFVPVVGDSVDLGAPPLESNNFVVGVAQLAARAKGNEGPYVTRFNFELLEGGQVGIFSVEDAMTTREHDGFGLTERTQNNGRATLRTIQRLRLRIGRSGEWWSVRAHHQPSKLRRFFKLRSLNSTNSPRYRAGSESL